MKKFLALVLALVMTMSLVTISAGAEDYTDVDNINYVEAVDVVSALGIVGGYADGSFGPNGTLTRGAAAKIICNLILGTTTASALSADTAPYKDVPVNHTFAGYIAYCQSEGIVSGYADGTFQPAAPLTGYAFMKMLLGCLGYDATLENYVGANWSVNVAKRALAIGLDDGMIDDFNGMKPVTRQEAALFTFNTLSAGVVSYEDKGTNITIGGTTINTGASEAEYTSNDASGYANKLNDANGRLQFAEKHFSKLERKAVSGDVFSRPADTWYYKGVKIGTYADTATLTYTKSVKGGDIFADLGMSTKDDDPEIWLNGKTVANGSFEVAKGNDIKLSDLNSKIGDGTIVEVYLNTSNNTVTICAQSVYAGEVTKVKGATAAKDAYVVVDYKGSTAGNDAPVNFSSNNTFETDVFEVDDIVAFTYSDSDKCIVSMYAIDAVEGTLTKVVSTKSINLDTTNYKFSEEYAAESLTVKGDYKVYVDENGYALYIKESDTSVENYALVLDITNSTWTGNEAKLLFTDGTTKTVELAKDYTTAANGDVDQWEIVAFKVDDGKYKLSVPATQDNDTDGDVSISNKVLTADELSVVATDNKTVFVVEKDANDYTAFTGIKNAPSITGAKAYALENADGDMLRAIFLLDGTVTATSADVVFVAGNSVSKLTEDVDNNQFYTYNAVVKGEVTSVMIKAGQSFTESEYDVLSQGEKYNAVFNAFDLDDGIIVDIDSFDTDGGDLTTGNKTGVRKYSDNELKLDNAVFSVAKNANIFIVDVDGNIETAEFSDIATDNNDEAFYTVEDGEITNLYIVEVKG